jgi:hypothetical protein
MRLPIGTQGLTLPNEAGTLMVGGIVAPKTWAKLLTARLSGVEPG